MRLYRVLIATVGLTITLLACWRLTRGDLNHATQDALLALVMLAIYPRSST